MAINFAIEEGNLQKQKTEKTVRKCLVDVYFGNIGRTYTYFNDQFELKVGDVVFVDGKLEGERGRVAKINYSFKIKLSDYKRVIAVADTEVHGELFFAGSHFVSFDPQVIPAEKIRTWFRPPVKEDEEFIAGTDGESFELEGLKGMKINDTIFERGKDYYIENHVKYICLDGNRGYAIVSGSEAYEVEFEYTEGKISNLLCNCFCNYNCKHEVAAMLQLQELLGITEKNYAEQYERSGYFAAILKGVFFSIVVDGHQKGSITF